MKIYGASIKYIKHTHKETTVSLRLQDTVYILWWWQMAALVWEMSLIDNDNLVLEHEYGTVSFDTSLATYVFKILFQVNACGVTEDVMFLSLLDAVAIVYGQLHVRHHLRAKNM